MGRAQPALISAALRGPSLVFEFEIIPAICFKVCTYLLKKTIQIFIFFLNWWQQLCDHYGRGARGEKSTVKCISLHSILDNGAKPSQSVLSEYIVRRLLRLYSIGGIGFNVHGT
jgi:hypothetical protein